MRSANISLVYNNFSTKQKKNNEIKYENRMQCIEMKNDRRSVSNRFIVSLLLFYMRFFVLFDLLQIV